MTPLETVEAALERTGSRRQRPGAWTCPAHDDQHASLSVKEGRDGRVLLTCHAGCTFESTVKALGLEPADLFPQREQGGSLDIAATYPYVDEQGRLLFEVVRLRPKGFRQRRPTAAGGWDWKLGATRRVLYRLPQVLAAVHAGRVVYVVEGEKDVHALEQAGVVATCNPGGAGKWRAAYSKTLAGADVVIVADLDEPGRRHARQVAAQLAEAGCTVRLVGAAAGKDAADHLAAGHALDELVPLQEEAEPPGEPAAGDQLAVIRACDVKPEPVRWLWPGRIPAGKLGVVDGDPGLGKSCITIDLVARVTAGSPMPDGHRLDARWRAALLSAEDGVADTLVPRLMAAGADLERVTIVDHVTDEAGPRPVELPGDLDRIQARLEREHIHLVVVDPLMAFLAADVNANRDQDVRRALHRLKLMAEATGAAVLVVRHLNKMPGGNPLYRGGGSIGIVGAARAGLLVGVDPDDRQRRILAVSKSNLAAKPPSLAYRIVEDELYRVAKVIWEGASTRTAEQLLGRPLERPSPEQDRGETFLREQLAAGPRRAADLRDLADARGLAWRTVQRAMEALEVEVERRPEPGKRGRGPSWWSLPIHASQYTPPLPSRSHGAYSTGEESQVSDPEETSKGIRATAPSKVERLFDLEPEWAPHNPGRWTR